MRYCINARQPISIIKKANEVDLEWKDREYLPQLIVDAPGIKINLYVPYDGMIAFDSLKDFINEGANISLGLSDISKKDSCNQYNIPYFQNNILSSYWEVENAILNGVSEIFIGNDLFFDLENLSKYKIPIRTIANLAVSNSNFLNDNGIKGTYIRPEDIEYYEQYIDVLSFYAENLKAEETLLKIYQEDHYWPGTLSKIIYNLKENVDNRALPEEFAQVRINCRQKCMRNKTCNFCENAFKFSKALSNFSK